MLRSSRAFDLPLDDHALHVRVVAAADPAASRRPTLVFLHDSLGSVTVWRDFPDRLAEALGCDALVYDRRGYGRSSPFGPEPRRPGYLEDEADVLGRVLDACGVAQAVLFGHSDGGSIALVAAAREPARMRAVVTEGAHVFVEELTLAGIRAAREALRTTDLRERLQRHHGERTDGVTAAWIDTWLSPAFRGWSIERYLPAIRCPVLAVQGTEDEYGTPAQVRAIVDGVAGPARGLLVPGVGHTPHRAAADDVLRATAAFLRETLPSLDVPSTPPAPVAPRATTDTETTTMSETNETGEIGATNGHVARASVATETPGRYIAQLCKHFAHKVATAYDPPTFEAVRGRVEFPDAGVCTLRAEPGSLELEIRATDAATLHRLEDVVARHLARFAWREPPTVAWR